MVVVGSVVDTVGSVSEAVVLDEEEVDVVASVPEVSVPTLSESEEEDDEDDDESVALVELTESSLLQPTTINPNVSATLAV